MILVDSSAWIEFDRATGSPADRRVRDLISSDQGAITEPVLMEVLAGGKDIWRVQNLRRLLMRFRLVRFESTADFEAAAGVYRRCREAGVTPRGLIDCMVCAVALRTGMTVLAHDRNFAKVGAVVSLTLDPASLQPLARP